MKKREIIIILSLIIAINVVVLLIYNLTPEQELRKTEYEISGGVGPSTEKTLKIGNAEYLKVMIGDMPISEVTGWMVDIFEDNLKIFKEETLEMNDAQLGEFYNNNKLRIKQELHIESQENFINLILKARKITCDLEEYDVCTFSKHEDSSETTKLIKFECSYSNGEKIEGRINGRIVRTAKLEF